MAQVRFLWLPRTSGAPAFPPKKYPKLRCVRVGQSRMSPHRSQVGRWRLCLPLDVPAAQRVAEDEHHGFTVRGTMCRVLKPVLGRVRGMGWAIPFPSMVRQPRS